MYTASDRILATSTRNVIGIFMNRILRGEPLPVFGDGEQTRAFSYIADVAPVIARSVERSEAFGQVFNIGADEPYTINQLIETVARVTGASPRVEYLPARQEVVHAYSDHEKVKKTFGDLIRDVPLEVGVRAMFEWVRRQGSRASGPFSQIEVRKNMPVSWV